MQDPPNVEAVGLRLSAGALGLLFQHDPQLKLDLSEQLIKELARKYLRQVAESAGFREWADAQAKAVAQAVRQEVGEFARAYPDREEKATLVQHVTALIRSRVGEAVEHAVGEAFARVLARHEEEARVRMEWYEGRLFSQVTDKVRDLYKDLDAKVDARIAALARGRVVAEARALLATAAALPPTPEPETP